MTPVRARTVDDRVVKDCCVLDATPRAEMAVVLDATPRAEIAVVLDATPRAEMAVVLRANAGTT